LVANIIITLLKNENNLVVDFVLHHVALGFDKIIMFDDMSTAPVSELISNLPEKIRNKVECHRLASEFYEWANNPDPSYFDEKTFDQFKDSKQMYLCNLALARFAEPTDWVAFTDVDEFLWLGEYGSIAQFRGALEKHGFAAVILTMLMYGHGYHLVPPSDNNICAFIWRASNFFNHGKFFAHVGAIRSVDTVHFPTLYSPRLLCDVNFKYRENMNDYHRPKPPNMNVPHLKHFIVQDVFSCFRRRIRPRISQRTPMSANDDSWLSRIDITKWSSMTVDAELAASLILTRVRAEMDVTSHARALTTALEHVPVVARTGSVLDFDYLRMMMKADQSEGDAEILFRYFTQNDPDPSMLCFARLPDDFDAKEYLSLHTDLRAANLTKRELEQHYLNYGRRERRKFKLGQ
jgi:hypothetical protein